MKYRNREFKHRVLSKVDNTRINRARQTADSIQVLDESRANSVPVELVRRGVDEALLC